MVPHAGVLALDETYNVWAQSMLPGDANNGNYWLFVCTDAFDQVYEVPFEGNNCTSPPTQITLSYAPPDLQPTASVEQGAVPVSSAAAGSVIDVIWSVANAGVGDSTSTSWTDRIYLSADAIPDSSDIVLGTATHTGGLTASANYNDTRSVTIPADTPLAGYNVLLCTDDPDTMFESDENNNCDVVGLTVTDGRPDLSATTVSVTEFNSSSQQYDPVTQTASGYRTIRVAWTVDNVGSGGTPETSWSDRVVISADAVLDGTDTEMGVVPRIGGVPAGGQYGGQQDFTIPVSFSAPAAHLFVCADSGTQVSEADENNNCANYGPFQVDWGAADLTVSSVTVSQSGSQALNVISGTTVTVQWQVENGIAAPTLVSTWTDRVYVSSDPVLDGGDTELAPVPHTGVLNPQGNYVVSRDYVLPVDAVGPDMRILVVADGNDQVYESDENNNVGVSNQLVVDWGPVDLIAENVSIVHGTPPGQVVDVTYTIRNIGGPTIAFGVPGGCRGWAEEVWLSSDRIFDDSPTDTNVFETDYNGELGHDESYTVTRSIPLAGATDRIPYCLSGRRMRE